jgi:O-antigen ligase
MTGQRLHTVLQGLFRVGALVTLCIAPTQWSLEPRPKLHVSPADLALALTAGVWLLDTLVARDWRRLLRLPPWPNLLFLACAGASALIAADKGAALKDLVQYVEYFLVGSMLFAAFLRDDARASRRTLAFLAVATAFILSLALRHYLSSDTPDLFVRGTFGNRNVLGGFLALALPLCFAGLFDVRALPLKAGLAALLLTGLAVNLSGASFFAVALVLVGMAATRGPKLFIPVAALLLVWQTCVLPRLPRENDLAHFSSVALYDGGQVERRYPDWQAAYSMLLTHPWLGVGLGNYQNNVGQYYDNIPRQTGPSEPDIQNLYIVLAASAGVPALLAFLAMLLVAAHAVCALPHRSALAWGAAGSLCAFGLTAVWHPLLVRGIGLPLAFLLAWAHHLAETQKADTNKVLDGRG